jgi:K+-sensing histidine kinase KdpD
VNERTYDDIMEQLDFVDGAPPRLGLRGGPIEVRARGPQDRWIELSTYPVVAQTSRTPAARETIVMLRDVTEARQREAVRDAFIGVLSHELRTPVTTIYGGSKVLARPGSSLSEERRRELFDDIRLEAERLHRLVEDVIALNRFGEDSGDIGREPILIQRILPGVVESERGRWPGAEFSVKMPPGIPTVTADETYVEQVIRNLLSNAAKYAGGTAHVETIVETSGDEVLVRVLDDGPGFPAEDSARLFDLFFRSPATAATAPGAGIGLFVCARLVRAMGGRIWAAPRDGGGAEFGFALRQMAED